MKVLIQISILLFFTSCTHTEQPGKSRARKSGKGITLQVAVNSDFIKYFDYPEIPFKPSDSSYYDPGRHQSISVFKSLKKENTNTLVTVFSLLTNDYYDELYTY